MECWDVIAPPPPAATDHIVSTGTTSIPLNVFGKWSWITDISLIDVIAHGLFNINDLPKLHREEEFRNRHVKTTAEGVFNPFDRSKPVEVYVGQTKLHQMFKEHVSFFGAWWIYLSIRTHFSPEHAPGLSLFNERIFHLIHCNISWPLILNYILAFFRKHQRSEDLNIWNDVDVVMITNNISVAQQKPQPELQSKSAIRSGRSSDRSVRSDVPIQKQICRNWNRADVGCPQGIGCQRRHVCSVCEKDGHRVFSCTME